MRGGFFASPNKITRAVDDLFLIAAGVQIYLTSAALRRFADGRGHCAEKIFPDQIALAGRKSWLRLSEQNLRIDKWSACQG
jgi:hypothetical protein